MQLDVTGALAQAWAKIVGWGEALLQHLPNLVAALLVLAAFVWIARLARRAARRLMDRFSDHGPVKNLVATAAWLGVLAAGAFVALGVLGLDRTVVSLLAGLGIAGLALGFAFQDIAENFIAGVLLSIRRPFTDGDLIETGDHFGTVESLDLRATFLRTPQGQRVRIPNSDVFDSALVNYTVTGQRRVDLAVGVSYGDDLEKAKRVALEAVESVEDRDREREPEFFYEGFGGSSIDAQVRFWIRRPGQKDFLRARSEAIQRIKAAFDAEGVTIPFPIRTLDFSPVGGRLLSEELPAGSREQSRAAAD